MSDLLKRIEKLEYHQELLLEMMPEKGYGFYRMVIRKGLSKKEVADFHTLCERLNKQWEDQKAEGFVFFAPLFKEFIGSLDRRLRAEEVIAACLEQELYPQLMEQLKRNL